MNLPLKVDDERAARIQALLAEGWACEEADDIRDLLADHETLIRRVEKLEEQIRNAIAALEDTELNMSNYTEVEVAALNEAAIDAYEALTMKGKPMSEAQP